jgi:hypothetical protein
LRNKGCVGYWLRTIAISRPSPSYHFCVRTDSIGCDRLRELVVVIDFTYPRAFCFASPLHPLRGQTTMRIIVPVPFAASPVGLRDLVSCSVINVGFVKPLSGHYKIVGCASAAETVDLISRYGSSLCVEDLLFLDEISKHVVLEE